ncbi:peptidylprolyl isomerase [Pseudazoarcus pumilus]|uniref:peptidylprolyl isomerase n=1 Tax=Pseudazoarcus pumilus TaxID=2067960 RepID=A0A2I6S6W8_9RHOO|nr:peptidylprolyl isomerase [Pseudazoarcus pumilus]AUN94992.1 peptidylprolyl isomerase [Pseudazoarcus pumilus]
MHEVTDKPARVNGVELHAAGEAPDAATLRQRACVELLRQRAIAAGLLAADDEAGCDGVISEAAAEAIEGLIDREVEVPEPDDEACRRHHAANAAQFDEGEALRLRHILFAVTPGVDVVALRKHAEHVLLEVRSHEDGVDPFVEAARTQSNCPSGAEGGDLGWLTRDDCAPEFARELFGRDELGVLPRLVHSRFGLHVVEVLERRPGESRAFEAVAGAVRASLRRQAYHTALRQYLALLAGAAELEGVDLDGADTPLVQ